jgi:hypothetical protein
MEQRTQFGPDPCPTPEGSILRTVGLVLFLVEHCPSLGCSFNCLKRLGLYDVPGSFFRGPRRSPSSRLVRYLYSPHFPAFLDLRLSEDLSGGREQGSPADGCRSCARFYLSSKYSSGTSSSGTSRVMISPSSASPTSSTPFTTSASNAFPSSSSSSTLSEPAPAIPDRP